MDTDPSKLQKLLTFLQRKRATVTWLVLASGILGGGAIAAISLLIPALEKMQVVTTATHYQTAYFAILGIWALSEVFLVVYWVRARSALPFEAQHLGILFAPHSDPECSELVESLYSSFSRDVRSKGFSGKIAARLVEAHETVNSPAEATALLNRTGAYLVIHGIVGKGQINGRVHQGFKRISFTVRKAVANEGAALPLLHAIGEMGWQVPESNSFIESQTLTENLSNASGFFIAMGLTLAGRLSEAREVWAALERALKSPLIPKSGKQLHRLSRQWWAVNELWYVSDRYNKEVRPSITRHEIHSVVQELQAILQRASKELPHDMNFPLMDAIFDFHQDEVQRARRTLESIVKATDGKEPASQFSLAFIALWQGKTKVALKHYRKAQRLGPPNAVVSSVMEFLQDIITLHPDKVHLRFALAVVNDLFWDEEQALSDYQACVDWRNGSEVCPLLLGHSRERVAALTQNRSQVG